MRSSLEFLFSKAKSAVEVNDDAQIRNIKQGSEQAFSRLYNEHVQELFNYGMHVCDDPGFVKNCLQELFVRVWNQRHDLRVAASIKSFLFRSLRKLLIEKLLTRKFKVRVSNFCRPQFESKLLANDDVFADHAVSRFNNERVIQGFTGNQAEAVFLKFNNGFSYHEVASIMDLNVETTYDIVFGAIEILRQRTRIAVGGV